MLERVKEGHRQSDKHWNCFKGNVGETFERWGRAHNYGLFHLDHRSVLRCIDFLRNLEEIQCLNLIHYSSFVDMVLPPLDSSALQFLFSLSFSLCERGQRKKQDTILWVYSLKILNM